MKTISDDAKFFFLDAECRLPESSYFFGYAFCKTQLVVSEQLNPVEMPSALDGAYVTVRRCSNECWLGTDWDGSGRLFVYHDPAKPFYWAVSNSFFYLVSELSKQKRALTPNPEILSAWTGTGAFLRQISSFDTAIRQIALVPRWIDLKISRRPKRKSRATLERVVRDSRDKSRSSSYAEALANYLSVWQARLANLSRGRSAMQVFISGGLDSRAAFATVSDLARNRQTARPTDRCIYAYSNPECPDEFAIAKRIVAPTGFPLNARVGGTRHSSVSDSVDYWERNRLGQCCSGYKISSSNWDLEVLDVKGSGGETVRDFYGKKANSLRDTIASKKKFFDDLTYLAFRDSVLRSTRAAARHSATQNLNVVNYQEFRARYHRGCRSFENVTIAPLSGALLDSVARHAPDHYFATNQIVFDVIANTDPELLNIAFDDPAKAPAPANRRALTLLDDRRRTAGEGKEQGVLRYSSCDPRTRTGAESTKDEDAMREFCSRLRRHYQRVSRGMLRNIDDVEPKIRFAEATGGLESRKDMYQLHAVYLFGSLKRLVR